MPNFLVVGAAKAGTTALYDQLRSHPEIFMSPIKEPTFFAADIDGSTLSAGYRASLLTDLDAYLASDMTQTAHIAHIGDWAAYRQLFRHVADEKAIGECSNAYLYSSVAASEIRRSLPYAKIIMVLRNPTERAYSHYLMALRIGLTSESFSAELDRDAALGEHRWGQSPGYVALGMYFQQVKRYLDLFPREQVRIYLYDDIVRGVGQFLDDLYRFLGVNELYAQRPMKRVNTAALPRARRMNRILHSTGIKRGLREVLPEGVVSLAKRGFYRNAKLPRMTASERRRLDQIFEGEILRLERLLDRDLSCWRQKA